MQPGQCPQAFWGEACRPCGTLSGPFLSRSLHTAVRAWEHGLHGSGPNKSSSGDVLLGTPLPQAPWGPHLTPFLPVPGILSRTESPEG